MILEYGIRNFLSFKEGATVSFRLDGKVPTEISGGRDFATVMCVKGANGSGKTHLLKGLAFLTHFICKSFNEEVDDPIPIDPFCASAEPSYFYVEFRIGGIDYRYDLEATRNRVERECLTKKVKREVKVFERVRDTVTTATGEFKLLKKIKLRKNASAISTARQHQISTVLPIHDFFGNIRFNVSNSGLRAVLPNNLQAASKFMHDHPEVLRWILKFLKDCDTGIKDIKILKETMDGDQKERYSPVFIHSVDGVDFFVPDFQESAGTKQLFALLLSYGGAVSTGATLILDEFDLYLHPDLLPKLLELFTNSENTEGAQLLFSTHQSDVMDICGRYRTYLVQKENNASFCYRLDEIPGDILRNGRSIAQPYKEGRIGGVPKL